MSIVRRQVLFAGLIGVAAVSCSSEAVDRTVATGESLSVSLMPNAIPGGAQPVLTVGTFAWSHPAIWLPRDLHGIVLYPDGTLLRIEEATPTELAAFSTSLPPETVSALLDAADRAGLGAGRALPAEPSPREVVDGGWTIVTRRSDQGIGRVVADQLGTEGNPAASERRTELALLVEQIPQKDIGTSKEVEIEEWVVESAQPLADLAATDWPWPDLDPENLAWDFNDAGVRCAIVPDADWPYTYDEASSNSQALPTGVFRRPLLPHESSCDDVFAWRDALGLGTEMITAPDLPRI